MSSLEENPKCARTYASFRLVGDALDPVEVDRRIGVKSDLARSKGEVVTYPTGRQFAQRTGVWLISSDDLITTTSIERHLILLLDILEPRRSDLLSLVEKYAVKADFFCLWKSTDGDGGPEVSPATLARIAHLGASLGFDFYPPSADEDH